MATDDKIRAMEVFWTSYDSDNEVENPLVHVPGLRSEGNMRVQGKRLKEIRAAIPSRQPEVQNLTPTKDADVIARKLEDTKINRPKIKKKLDNQKILKDKTNGKKYRSQLESPESPEVANQTGQKVALKDLCPEDKQRVANLVKELARVGEEKENVREALEIERINFEQQIKDVLAQQEKTLAEREAIQQQLLQCQQLLSRYQTILLHQRADVTEVTSQESKQRETKEDKKFGLNPRPEKPKEKLATPPRAKTSQKVRQHAGALDEQAWDTAAPGQQSNLQPPHPTWPTHGQLATEPPAQGNAQTGRKLPQQPEDRPFTNMIDKLIAQEKHNATYGHDPTKIKSETMGVSCMQTFDEVPKDGLFGVGPLVAPVMASTQRDELDHMGQYQAPLGMCKEEFHPLQPDSGQSSLQSPPHTPQMLPYSPDAPMYNGHTGDAHKGHSNYGPRTDFTLDTAQFHAFYQQLSPMERKRQLLMQKEALLSEQRRLRHVLSEQEALLRSKQEQLHRQQQRQRQRLSFFQQTGYFPPATSVNGHASHATDAYGSQGGMHAPTPGPSYPSHSMHNGAHMAVYSGPSTSSGPMGYHTSSHPHPAQTDYSQGGGHPIHNMQAMTEQSAHRHYYGDPHVGMDMGSYQHPAGHSGYGAQYSPNSGPPQGQVMQQEDASESMENLHFLERHGVNVAHMRREQRKGLEMPEMRSAATSPLRPTGLGTASPLRPTGLGNMSRYTDAETQYSTLENAQLAHHIEALNSHRGDSDTGCMKTGGRGMDTMRGHRHASYERNDMMPPPQTDHAAYLLDIVDEVESEHNRSHNSSYHGYPMPHHQMAGMGTGYPGGGSQYNSGPEEMHSMDDLEESRVLEEVFFVK